MRDFFSLERWLPGLAALLQYQRAWLMPDLRAGLSVAAVALPVAIAYAELAGVGAIVGLYSCILPMVVYALFGTSRQLIVGPDAATCAVIAAVVTPLAAGDPTRQWQLVMTMTAMTGFWCLIASRFKLGVLADFLSRPILMGLLNGVAITIMVGQLSKIFGFTFSERYLIERILNGTDYITQTHLPTLAMSLTALLTLLLAKRYRPSWPSSMVAMVVTAALVWAVQSRPVRHRHPGGSGLGLPAFQMPDFPPGLMRELVLPALNLAMVSFVSMMLTARSFAAKNGYEIDADKEFRALGMANLASAVSQGFAISGADSRTAVNDANGGKSQLVSIIAAAVIALITFYLTAPLQFIPTAALGVVLVMASLSLTDFRGLWALRDSDRAAFWLALITFVSVLTMGVIPGITLAVLLGLFQFLRNVMRPTDQLLGMDDEGRGAHPGGQRAGQGDSRHPGLPLQLPAHLLQRPLLQAAGAGAAGAGSPQSQVPGGGCGGLLHPSGHQRDEHGGRAAQGAQAARHPHGDGRSARPDEPVVQTGGDPGRRGWHHPLPRHVSGPAHDPLLPGAGVPG
jgi:MFS superfamily sulfate permease-like transporter